MKKILLLIIILLTCGCEDKNTYLVTFDSAGGSIVMDVLVPSDTLLEEPLPPVKDEYVFAGWYQNDTKYDFSIPINKDINLKAHWLKKETCNLTCDIGFRIDNPNSKDCTCIKSTTPVVTEIKLNKDSLTLETGAKEKISATIIPSNVPFIDIKWSSSNPKVATIDNGLITGLSKGDSIITASFGDKQASLVVIVINKELVKDYLKYLDALINKGIKELNNNYGFGKITKKNNNIDIEILDKVSVALNVPIICNNYLEEYLNKIDKDTVISYAINMPDNTLVEGSNKELGLSSLIKTLRDVSKHFKGKNNKISIKITISLNKDKVTKEYIINVKKL